MKTDNELIAEFMGAFKPKDDHKYWSFINNISFCEAIHTPGGEYIFYPNELKFDEYWDWLMPVVEKVCADGHFVQTTWTSDVIITIAAKNDVGWTQVTKQQGEALKAIYSAVVEFIKWHNEQKS